MKNSNANNKKSQLDEMTPFSQKEEKNRFPSMVLKLRDFERKFRFYFVFWGEGDKWATGGGYRQSEVAHYDLFRMWELPRFLKYEYKFDVGLSSFIVSMKLVC